MFNCFLRVMRMLLFGVTNIRLYKGYRPKHYNLNRTFLTPEERWQNIGIRLRGATLRVPADCYKIDEN